MNRTSLEFESPDLAGWIWVAVALLALAEGVRYVLAGRRSRVHRPTLGPVWRASVVLFVAGALGALKIRGWIRLEASSHGWACLWLGVFAILWLVRSYRRTTRVITRRARLGLLSLRLLAGMLVILMLARPVLQTVQVRRERALLGIMLDNSRSMGVRDVLEDENAEPIPRVKAVLKTIETNRSALDRLTNELEVRWFSFDTEATEIDSALVKGDGAYTALADSLEQVHNLLSQEGARIGSVIIISDGRDNFSRNNDPMTAGDTLASAGVPIYCVGVGSEVPIGQTRCLRARRLDSPTRVAVLNRTPVHAEFLCAGLSGTIVNVELLYDEKVVEQKRVSPRDVRELIRVDLTHIPAESGLHRLTVRAKAEAIEGEQGVVELSQFVRVTDDKIAVLYIDRPRYERAAIARALESAKELRVKKVELNRPAGSGASPMLLKDEIDWRAYGVVLIGDVERSSFPPESLAAIADLVTNQGRGLAVLGGMRTLGSGQYGQTALDDLLAVDLGATGQVPGPLAFELTPAGRAHPICRLGGEASADEDLWKIIPPFSGASLLGNLGASAEVLISASSGQPLLVVQETGKGRVAVLAFDSTWQWSFADEKGAEAQKRFWRQLVLWLANQRPDVWVVTNKPRYDLAKLQGGAERVIVQAGVTDPTTGRTPHEVKLTGTIVKPDGRSGEIRWVRKADCFEAELQIDEAGEFRIEVVAGSGDEIVGRSQAAFVVTSTDPELDDPLADLEALKRLSARTGPIGGEYVPLGQLGQLLERIRSVGYVSEITRISRAHLVDEHPWKWLVAFLLLVTIEWIARRRLGLV